MLSHLLHKVIINKFKIQNHFIEECTRVDTFNFEFTLVKLLSLFYIHLQQS